MNRIYKKTVEIEVFGEWFFIEAEVEEVLNEAEKRYEFYLLRTWGLDPDVHPVTKDFISSEALGLTPLIKQFETELYKKIQTWATEYNYEVESKQVDMPTDDPFGDE